MTISKLWVSSLALLATVSLPLQAASPVTVGSKIDTEGALLGNMILQVLESHGVKTVNKIQLGTTPVVRGAITAGELDIVGRQLFLHGSEMLQTHRQVNNDAAYGRFGDFALR